MRRIVGFGRFWWDFVVGDDWRIAAGITVTLTVTAIVAHAGLPAFWIVPVAVATILAVSIRRQ